MADEDQDKKKGLGKLFIGCSVIISISVLIIIIGIITCDTPSNSTNYNELINTQTTTKAKTEVFYQITGTATKVDVTLNNATGGTEQYSDVYLPKTYRFYDFKDNFLYISAQNSGSSGTVIVTIYVDGVEYKTSSSSGAYVIASASGSLGY